MMRTAHINRHNMLENLFRIDRELRQGLNDSAELRRLLDEATHVMAQQQASRQVAQRAAQEAVDAAAVLIMPNTVYERHPDDDTPWHPDDPETERFGERS